MLRLAGDLIYLDRAPKISSRELTIITVERAEPSSRPEPRSALDFIRFRYVGMSERDYTTEGLFERHYKYVVESSDQEVPETFAGEVIVTDPWVTQRTVRLPVQGQFRPIVSALTKRLRIEPRPNDANSRRAKLLLLANEDDREIHLRMEKDDSALAITRQSPDVHSRLQQFTIELSKTAELLKTETVYHIIVSFKPGGREEFRVPVSVVKGE